MGPLTLRRWHSYLSLLGAPSILFFTLTGSLQLFSWHEAHGTYQPPAWLEKLSSVHKDQVLEKHEEREPEADKPAAEGEPRHEDSPLAPATVALKAYFFWVGIMLVVSTTFGAWMGLTQIPRKRLAWSLLTIGTALPIGILLFGV